VAIMKRNMVNNSINITKTKNHLPYQTIEHTTDRDTQCEVFRNIIFSHMVRYSCEGRIITVIQNKAIKHICLMYCVPRNSGIKI
jgi:signal transduction histidine kinase